MAHRRILIQTAGAALAVCLLAGLGLLFVAAHMAGEPMRRGLPPNMQANLRRLHRGPPPCLRHLEKSEVDDADVRGATQTLLQAGLTRHQVSELVAYFTDWNEELEKPRHLLSVEDETTEASWPGYGLLGQVFRRYAKGKMGEAKRRVDEDLRPRAQKAWALLSVQQQQSLRAAHAAHPSAFAAGGLLKLIDMMAVELTRQRMVDIAAKIEEHQAAHGPLERLDALGLPSHELMDSWERDFDWDGSQLVSLGVDQYPGGTGVSADLVRIIGATGTTVGRSDPIGSVQCAPLPATTRVARAEVDAALADTAKPACRIVPSFKDGVAEGLKLFGVRVGTLLARAGFCSGDVVLSVGGLPLTSPEKALESYAKIKEANEVSFRVRRDGVEGELRVLVE